MIRLFISTVTGLQQVEYKLIAENNIPNLGNVDIVKKSKKQFTPSSRHEKVNTLVPKHLLGPPVIVNHNVLFWIGRKVSQLQHFSDHNAGLCTCRAEIVLSEGLRSYE